jgi:zinc transporter ZupT
MSQATKPNTTRQTQLESVPTWLVALGPLALLGLALWALVALRPIERLRGGEFPPVEELTVVRTVLPRPGLIELYVVNGGPDPVTIAQVMVDEAYWSYWIDAGKGPTNDAALAALPTPERREEWVRRATIPRLGRARVHVDYPWVEGEAHEIVLVSSTGVTFNTAIDVAVESPAPTAGYFALFAVLGVFVGVIPVYLGLLWYPLVQRLSERTINALLCFTVGLLAFLVVDAVAEAFEASQRLPGAFEGPAVIVLGVAGAVLLLTAVGGWTRSLSARRGPGVVSLGLAYMIAAGIGLHNLGEGLAIGAAFNLGEVSLTAMLIGGFMLHNITEGLAIVSPLAGVRARLAHFLWLGLLAGAPTILGGWMGAFAYSPFWAVLFLAVGAGAILQVAVEILRQIAGGAEWRAVFTPAANLGGLAAGYVVMYLTGLTLAF